MDQDILARQMLNCDISNGYEGLEELKRLASTDPEAAWRIIWTVLTKGADPGRDDGALCFELLVIASSCLDRPSLEVRLLDAWGSLAGEIRRNLIHGFANANVVSLTSVIELFDHPSTSVRERHLILATLASCRHKESPQMILNMTQRIGQYENANRQAKLEAFVKSVIATYE